MPFFLVKLLLLSVFTQASVKNNEDYAAKSSHSSLDIQDLVHMTDRACEHQLVKSAVNPLQNEFLLNLAAQVFNYPQEKTFITNNFRSALELTGTHLPDPEGRMRPTEFVRALESFYREVATSSDLQIGDLVVLEERGSYMIPQREDEENTYVWTRGSEVVHALVYIGGGLVVQKDNATPSVSSISTLDRAVEKYTYSAQSITRSAVYSAKKTSIIVRIFRKNYSKTAVL